MKRIALITLVVASSAPLALAQGTITDGAATFTLEASPWDISPGATFTGVSATLTQDHLFEIGWWYRVQGDTLEKFFPPPTTQSYVGTTATISWTNVDARGFDAQVVYTVTNRGGPSGIVDGRLTITNPGGSPLAIDIFNMADVDLNGSTNDSGTLITANNHINITDPSGNTAQYRGVGADAFLARPFGGTDVANVLSNTTVDNFDNSGLPFAAGDITAGFQWTTVTIPAGGSRTYAVAVSVNYSMDRYFPVTPCRVIDTRNPPGPLGGPALAFGADRTFTIVGNCGVPASAKALAINVAVTNTTDTGNLRLYPAGTALPMASSVNYSAGQTRSNNGIVPLSGGGQITVRCTQGSGTTDLILDVFGYFQ